MGKQPTFPAINGCSHADNSQNKHQQEQKEDFRAWLLNVGKDAIFLTVRVDFAMRSSPVGGTGTSWFSFVSRYVRVAAPMIDTKVQRTPGQIGVTPGANVRGWVLTRTSRKSGAIAMRTNGFIGGIAITEWTSITGGSFNALGPVETIVLAH